MDKGIKKRIEERGATVSEVARRLGVSEESVREKYERPDTFTVTEILALSVWLGIPADELLGLEDG